MKVYVSSTFVDLQDYRAGAIRILRQLGHEVVAMEDYVADSAIPLEKVLEDVESCDVYVGIFAWRYGFIPGKSIDDDVTGPKVSPEFALPTDDAEKFGQVSITEWEYLQATKLDRPILAFLLEESVPWPPHLIDGFEQNTVKHNIRKLRENLQRQRMVAYFKSPEDLEARISAAITTVNMSAQVAVNLINPATTPQNLEFVASGENVRDSGKHNFVDAVIEAQAQRIIRIDIGTIWWSTRLFLLAYMVERLTDVRRILVLNGNGFVGLLSTSAILRTLVNFHKPLLKFERQMGRTQRKSVDFRQEAERMIEVWNEILPRDVEAGDQRNVTPENLRWWFGDSMLAHSLKIADLESANPFDLARIIDFPSDYVPVVTAPKSEIRKRSPESVVMVVDKTVLNAELAGSYLADLLTRAGIRTS